MVGTKRAAAVLVIVNRSTRSATFTIAHVSVLVDSSSSRDVRSCYTHQGSTVV